MKCDNCKKDVPPDTIQPLTTLDGRGNFKSIWRCAVCALEARNRIAGLPANEPFAGPIARSMYDKAIAHLRATGQDFPAVVCEPMGAAEHES